jgi:CRISPR-associated protein Cmr3
VILSTVPQKTTAMTTLKLKAIDTLFFRDGKPFSMGEETLANGIFPPFPSALYGTLRSIYFADHLPELALANVAGDPTGKFEISGFLPSLNDIAAFPIPQDLYAKKREKGQNAWRLVCHNIPSSVISDYDFDCVLQTSEATKVEELGGKGFLDKENFKTYLSASKDELVYEKVSDYLLDEPKIGMGRDYATRSASEGKLYRVNMRRLEGPKGILSFLVKYGGLNLPEAGISRMGAETKSIEYRTSNADGFPSIVSQVQEGDKLFKIYLATPAIFEEGFYPKTWFSQNGLKLLTAAIGRVQHVGGFDYKATFPKPMYKALPSGTVYYVEVTDTSKAKGLVSKLHEGSIYNLAPDKDTFKNEFRKQGFGLTYLGKFNIQ